jgi:tetratricopeptide (TPR) repeat protein
MVNKEITHVYVMIGFFVLVLCGLGAYFIWQPSLGGWFGGSGPSSSPSSAAAADPYGLLIDSTTRRIEADPDAPEGYLERAEYHHRFGYLEEALADYTAAIERGEDSSAVFFDRAQALYSLGRLEQSVEDYSRGVERSPFNEAAIWNRARLRQELGQWTTSVTELQAALDRTESSRLYQELAWAQWGTGDYEGALASFSRVIELGAVGLHPYMARGITLGHLGHPAEAEADLEEAVSYRQQGADYAHFALWLTRARQGHRLEADETLAAYFDDEDAPARDPWPTMIAEFMLGRITEARLLEAAAYGEVLTPEQQAC